MHNTNPILINWKFGVYVDSALDRHFFVRFHGLSVMYLFDVTAQNERVPLTDNTVRGARQVPRAFGLKLHLHQRPILCTPAHNAGCGFLEEQREDRGHKGTTAADEQCHGKPELIGRDAGQ